MELNLIMLETQEIILYFTARAAAADPRQQHARGPGAQTPPAAPTAARCSCSTPRAGTNRRIEQPPLPSRRAPRPRRAGWYISRHPAARTKTIGLHTTLALSDRNYSLRMTTVLSSGIGSGQLCSMRVCFMYYAFVVN